MPEAEGESGEKPDPPKPAIVARPVPLPIKDFGNAALRDSVTKALSAVPAGHGNAFLDVDNKGAGVMVAHRFENGWALMGGVRYNWEDKGVAATVGASW